MAGMLGPQMVRYKVFLVSPAILMGMFTTGRGVCYRTDEGFPEGARLIGVRYEHPHVMIWVEHESFAEIPYESPAPEGSITCTRFYDHPEYPAL
jgi:hypothetical protein